MIGDFYSAYCIPKMIAADDTDSSVSESIGSEAVIRRKVLILKS